MKPLLLASLLAFASVSCREKPNPSPAASSAEQDAAMKRAEAAKRYDREHDAAMEKATHGTIPEPRPAGPLK